MVGAPPPKSAHHFVLSHATTVAIRTVNFTPFRLLVKNRVSDNVGHVKLFLEHTAACTRRRAPFRSSGESAMPTKARLVILPGQDLGPTHASLRSATAIMITN